MKNIPSTDISPIQPRRSFLKQSLLLSTGILFPLSLIDYTLASKSGMVLRPTKIKGLKLVDGEPLIEQAQWYTGQDVLDGFYYEFPTGSLADMKYITTDMLANGSSLIQFNIELQEGADGRIFQFAFGVLTQCSLRVRLPLRLVDQNTWRTPRDGAFLKPMCWGDRVDLEKVDRIKFYINRKSESPATFCLTPLLATENEVSVIKHPVLPKGKLLDEIGQSTLHNWDGKTKNLAALKTNLTARLENTKHTFPNHFSKWGGSKAQKLDEGTGFFRVYNKSNRWWLVDPDGHLFWSMGIDSVRVDTSGNMHLLEDALEFIPPQDGAFSEIYSLQDNQLHINYLAANFIRTFGTKGWRDKWATIALDELRRLRFNTVGNWSEWNYASKAVFPYVRPMSFKGEKSQRIYRDFPDVFHPDFEIDAVAYAKDLEESVDDPALIGYFMMNEPQWAFSKELPAVGMLYNNEASHTRTQLTQFLKKKYASDAALAESWKMDIGFAQIETGKWKEECSADALVDLEAFSAIMVEKYFGTLSAACKKVDPNHLNLGIRYQGVPPQWAVSGMQSFDIFSMNNYQEKVPFDQTEKIHDLLQMPIMIGEWHFGALDVGLPASGIGHVRTQKDRGKAYRVYLEDAAANPYCVGVHWFVLYDQSAIGRFDGENYNIGFLDICNQPHKPLCEAATASHESIYDIATGKKEPFDDAPEYLPKLFL